VTYPFLPFRRSMGYRGHTNRGGKHNCNNKPVTRTASRFATAHDLVSSAKTAYTNFVGGTGQINSYQTHTQPALSYGPTDTSVCQYGEGCYRQNSEHINQCHGGVPPGQRGSQQSAATAVHTNTNHLPYNRQSSTGSYCQYGAACTRQNPDHIASCHPERMNNTPIHLYSFDYVQSNFRQIWSTVDEHNAANILDGWFNSTIFSTNRHDQLFAAFFRCIRRMVKAAICQNQLGLLDKKNRKRAFSRQELFGHLCAMFFSLFDESKRPHSLPKRVNMRNLVSQSPEKLKCILAYFVQYVSHESAIGSQLVNFRRVSGKTPNQNFAAQDCSLSDYARSGIKVTATEPFENCFDDDHVVSDFANRYIGGGVRKWL
jgi:hypothetical protein